MPLIADLRVLPSEAANEQLLKEIVAGQLNVQLGDIRYLDIVRRSFDARQKQVKVNLKVAAYINEEYAFTPVNLPHYPNVKDAREIIIIGAGPAGLFAALRCIELGLKPVILERGKDVRARRRDIAAISKQQLVNEDSNYCFGEGGAGTYSDGKLYTRSKKRGDVNRILQLLVGHGATGEILVDAHPHIGTNKLPGIIANMRETIVQNGGEVRFNTKVSDILISSNKVTGVEVNQNETIKASHLILATGHSARDIFEILKKQKIEMEVKPFAIGVRIEHPQALIDSIRYHCNDRGPYLPPASYNVVKQAQGRGVYSFCMCPGGIIAPCATQQEEIVTNGWSPSRRDQPFANSGIVVELNAADFNEFSEEGPLAGVAYQRHIEHKAWLEGGRTQVAPAQRVMDFIHGKQSADLPPSSYQPGIVSVEMKSIFPPLILKALQEGLNLIGKGMHGYLTNDAVIHAPESRTSSPVRIPRDRETYCHTRIEGLYPCGEGAGYAGGIVSAAIDGEKCAEKCAISLGISTGIGGIS